MLPPQTTAITKATPTSSLGNPSDYSAVCVRDSEPRRSLPNHQTLRSPLPFVSLSFELRYYTNAKRLLTSCVFLSHSETLHCENKRQVLITQPKKSKSLFELI